MKGYASLVDDAVIQKGLAAALVVIHGQVVLFVQVDQGALRNSVGWAIRGKSGGYDTARKGDRVTSAEMLEEPEEDLVGYVGSAKAYAGAQEYGLARYGRPNYKFHPYLRPGFTFSRRKANMAFARVLRAEMRMKGGES